MFYFIQWGNCNGEVAGKWSHYCTVYDYKGERIQKLNIVTKYCNQLFISGYEWVYHKNIPYFIRISHIL